MTKAGRAVRLAAVATIAITLVPSAASAQASYVIGGGVAGGVGGYFNPAWQYDALAAQLVGVLHANSRSRPIGGRLEVIIAGLGGLDGAEPAAAPCPLDVVCLYEAPLPEPERLRAAVLSATWGTRAERSGAYLIGGVGAYSVPVQGRSDWTTAPGVNGGIGVSYFERRGRNRFYAEARWHRIVDGARSANHVIPLSVGVLF
jgi:hypothetical protein